MTRTEALARLHDINGDRDKIEKWNCYRKSHPEWVLDLSDEENPAQLAKIKLCSNVRDDDWTGVDLHGAKLYHANLTLADLQAVDLRDANLSHADLTESKLKYADLTGANLRDTDLRKARLSYATLNGADLRGADFSMTGIFEIKYDRSRMRGKCLGIKGLESCFGDAFFRRDAQDQDFIDNVEMRMRRGTPWQRILFRLWAMIDFGRALRRVILIAFGVAVFIGLLYWLDWFFSLGFLDYTNSANTWLTPFYYSIGTFTTLGFGDVTPAHWVGEMVVIIEGISGYLTLGLILAILAKTVARRA